jgi:hypothetical protein
MTSIDTCWSLEQSSPARPGPADAVECHWEGWAIFPPTEKSCLFDIELMFTQGKHIPLELDASCWAATTRAVGVHRSDATPIETAMVRICGAVQTLGFVASAA